jgi:hypothetical protein
MTELVVMRLKDMYTKHPNQDNTHKCSQCGFEVGIYPSGQKVLKENPDAVIICQICIGNLDLTQATPAPGALEEAFGKGRKK